MSLQALPQPGDEAHSALSRCIQSMITLTKIFRFEAAHAIHGYTGACANIHGHSYELHVCVSGTQQDHRFIEGSGMVMDFKDLKKWWPDQ